MNQSNRLKQSLQIESRFSKGFNRVSYPTKEFDLRKETAQYLLEKGFTSNPLPFEDLQLRISLEDQATIDSPINAVTTKIEEISPSFKQTYHALIKYIAKDILGFDCVFEASPFLRFHFPGRLPNKYRSKEDFLLTHHSDTLLGDYFEQINCWLPLSKCYGTNTLQLSTLDESIDILTCFAQDFDFDEDIFMTGREKFYNKLYSDDLFQAQTVNCCKPLEISYGELMMFDPRMIHATAENVEKGTRVSIDFRLVPLEAYEALKVFFQREKLTSPIFEGEALVRGGYYHERTAFEL